MIQLRSALAVLGAGMAVAGCVTVTPENAEDPYEPFNRQMYAFNDGLDRTVVEPAARGYRAVTNRPVRRGVSNFMGNLGEPVTFANNVLQGRLGDAAGTAGRFVINTTIGLAGLFDPAEAMGIERKHGDFGQTLGIWGVAPGHYLVLPFIGPTSPRDLLGRGVDFALNPINNPDLDIDMDVRIGLAALGGLSARENALETVENIRTTQVDPYITVRRFHVRNRADMTGKSPPGLDGVEEVPDYELDF